MVCTHLEWYCCCSKVPHMLSNAEVRLVRCNAVRVDVWTRALGRSPRWCATRAFTMAGLAIASNEQAKAPTIAAIHGCLQGRASAPKLVSRNAHLVCFCWTLYASRSWLGACMIRDSYVWSDPPFLSRCPIDSKRRWSDFHDIGFTLVRLATL